MNEEENQYFTQMEQQLALERQKNVEIMRAASPLFTQEQEENLIKYQLNIDAELERIEHLLRGHTIKIDKQGNEYWEEPKTEEEKIFNDLGVKEVLKLLKWYLNKNIILSNYSEEMINLRIKQLGFALTDFIFCNYDRFGWNDEHKIKHFEMVVMNIINTIEASYFRALHGGERDSLRTARHVTQSQNMINPFGGGMGGMGGGNMMMPQQQQSKSRWYNPLTWGK